MCHWFLKTILINFYISSKELYEFKWHILGRLYSCEFLIFSSKLSRLFLHNLLCLSGKSLKYVSGSIVLYNIAIYNTWNRGMITSWGMHHTKPVPSIEEDVFERYISMHIWGWVHMNTKTYESTNQYWSGHFLF